MGVSQHTEMPRHTRSCGPACLGLLAQETPWLVRPAAAEATWPCQHSLGMNQGKLTVLCPLLQHPASH